jgi:hypothetical protein
MIMACMAMVRYPVGGPVPCEIYTAVSDPCDPALQYILPADPNWMRDFGDNERTRILMNISVNRGMALRNTQFLAELSKRFLALDALHKDPNDPNEKIKGQ